MQALLELTGFTGIYSEKDRVGPCMCVPLLSEAMDPVLTFGDRYNGGIVTDRRTKYTEEKKGRKKMTGRKG